MDRSLANTTSSCYLEWTEVWLTQPHLVVGSGKVSFLSVCRAVSKAEREESAAGERSRRKKGTAALAGLLPEVVRKPRKQLTPEELEARRKKVSCPATSPYPFVWMNERWVVRPVLLLYPFVWINEWWVVQPVLLLVLLYEWWVVQPVLQFTQCMHVNSHKLRTTNGHSYQ